MTPTVAVVGATMTGALVTETAIESRSGRAAQAVGRGDGDDVRRRDGIRVGQRRQRRVHLDDGAADGDLGGAVGGDARAKRAGHGQQAVGVAQDDREGLARRCCRFPTRLTPAIAVALPAEVLTLVGAVMTGGPFTVTAMSNGVPAPPWAEVALNTIVSDGVVPSLSYSVTKEPGCPTARR